MWRKCLCAFRCDSVHAALSWAGCGYGSSLSPDAHPNLLRVPLTFPIAFVAPNLQQGEAIFGTFHENRGLKPL